VVLFDFYEQYDKELEMQIIIKLVNGFLRANVIVTLF
jgi:hypothetical protein